MVLVRQAADQNRETVESGDASSDRNMLKVKQSFLNADGLIYEAGCRIESGKSPDNVT